MMVSFSSWLMLLISLVILASMLLLIIVTIMVEQTLPSLRLNIQKISPKFHMGNPNTGIKIYPTIFMVVQCPPTPMMAHLVIVHINSNMCMTHHTIFKILAMAQPHLMYPIIHMVSTHLKTLTSLSMALYKGPWITKTHYIRLESNLSNPWWLNKIRCSRNWMWIIPWIHEAREGMKGKINFKKNIKEKG